MSHRFVRCPHCKTPHEAAMRVCPTTRRRIAPQTGSKMSELPPPERRPEPLDFRPSKVKAPIVPEARSAPPARKPKRDLIGETIGGRYRFASLLGEGGMGMVFEAEHIGLGRRVAVKVLNPSQAKKRVAIKRFQQEARAAGAIGHPNICEVYDMGVLEDGSPYLVMEKLHGRTLSDWISRQGGLPFDDLVRVMIQVLSGLVAAHEKGIIHRDIKPENIFLAERAGCAPIAKILDFGVSKMMPSFLQGEEPMDLTRTGMVMGTPYYMSPEQARGERNLDGRVDVYACGVMMYEAIVGRRPFVAPNYNALLLAIINSAPTPLGQARPDTPPALVDIVARAMAKARSERIGSASQFQKELQSLSRRVPPAPLPELRPGVGSRAEEPRAGAEGVSSTRPDVLKPGDRAAPEAPLPGFEGQRQGFVAAEAALARAAAAGHEPELEGDEMPTEVFRPRDAARGRTPLPPPSVPPRRSSSGPPGPRRPSSPPPHAGPPPPPLSPSAEGLDPNLRAFRARLGAIPPSQVEDTTKMDGTPDSHPADDLNAPTARTERT